MASSLLAGDRRWASARKSGMTVLGKVPKPINLPSQRLENNGVDPNVEIVPKGTLTWGSRPTSAVPNAWSSSALLSPKTDGTTGSPSHANGRPSSGGSGTRPSTAGNDRSHEPPSNAWGPKSRPSSASGLLATNQTSMIATRPRSAETRPGNSQLSRVAENSADSTVAWGPTRTTDRVGPPSSKTNGFILSSGDFPTLGSEKNESHSQQGHSSQGHPASASDTDAEPKEELESPVSGDAKIATFSEQGTMHAQKKDNYLYVGGGAPANMNWQMEPQHAQQYPSLNMTPHQFDSWHGPPLHSPDGIWYKRGGAGGPYRPTSPHGGLAADHFGYYPQFPPISEAVPRPGAGQCGYHPNDGTTYRPHVRPSSFMVASHPGLPAGPGVYQASVPYDGYHGMPQVGFCSYSEREVPFTGVACQPRVSDQHPHQNGNLNPGHLPIGGHDPSMAKEQTETDWAHGTHQEQHKAFLKKHDGWEDNKLQKMGHPVVSNPPHLDKGSRPGGSAQEECWHMNSRQDEHAVLVDSKPDCEGLLKPSSDCEGHSSEPVIVGFKENSDKAADGVLMRRPETSTSLAHDWQRYPVTKKNVALTEKLGGLNNKVRYDCQNDVTPFSFREEKRKQLKAETRKADNSTKVICSHVIPTENAPSFGMVIPTSSEVNSSAIENEFKSSSDGKAGPRPSESQIIALGKLVSSKHSEVAHSHNYRRNNVTRTRVDHHVKSVTNSQGQAADGWTMESPGKDTSLITTVTNGNGPRIGVPDGHSSQETAVKESDHAIISGSCTSTMDSLNYQTQHAKMKEIAAQRARQLQEEEEERTREQKAKALAKLEEVNRQSSVQSSKQKPNDSIQPSINMQHNQDSGAGTALKTDATNNEVPGVMSAEKSDALIQANDCEHKNLPAPADLPSDMASEYPASHDPSLPLRQENKTAVDADQKMSSHVHDISISNHKHMSYRRKQSVSMEKNRAEKPITAGNMECPKNLVEVAVHASNDSLPHNEGPSMCRNKNNRNSRNKNKLDEAPMSSTRPSLAHTDGNIENGPSDCQKIHPPALVAETVVVSAQNSWETSRPQVSTDVMVTSSKSTEQAHGRITNQWKPQPPRRSARNQQRIKPVDRFHVSDAVIWAPVKLQNKNEQQPEEIRCGSMTVASNQSLGNKEHHVHNGKKTKRAEMVRYIPKPVAKEILQQENSQQSSSLEQALSGDTSEKPEFHFGSLDRGRPDGLAVGKMEFLADTKNVVENKPNRHARIRVFWCQRSSAESASAVQGTGEGSGSSGAAKVAAKPSDQHELLNPDSQLEKFKSDGRDSNNANALPTEMIAATADVKDQGVTSRQKRQQFMVHRVAGSNHAPAGNKDLQTGIDDKSDIQNPAPDLNETDIRNTSKSENKISGGEHVKPHWKPKSRANSHNQGNMGNGGREVAFHSGRSDKEFASECFEGNHLQCFDGNPLQEDRNALTQKTRVGECYQEVQGDMKIIVDQSKQQNHTLNQEVPINVALGPENVKAHHEHQVTPGRRQHSGRFHRGQGAAYRGRESGRDAGSGQQNFQMNEERRKNSHYEYQPIGPYSKPSDSSQWNPHVGEEAQEGSLPPGLRYREHGQNHSRGSARFFRRSDGAAVHGGEPYNSVENEF